MTEGFLVKLLKNNIMTIKKISYKEAVAEIEEILEKIEHEDYDVDELTEKVKRVSLLLKICKDKLTQTNEQVEQILKEIEE